MSFFNVPGSPFGQAYDLNQLLYWDQMTGLNYLNNSYSNGYYSDPDVPDESQFQMARRNKSNAANERCKFFQRGYCKYGSQCRFSHSSGDDRESSADTCAFFLKGSCRYGASCRFKHTAPDGTVAVGKQTSDQQIRMIFSPSDDDLKAGRLTRIRLCFDLPVKDSVKNEFHQSSGCQYFLDIFVDKRDDDVRYLYDTVTQRAANPLYAEGMFDLSKAGTNLDLSDLSKKLMDTSIFIFGSSVDVLPTQSRKLAAILANNDDLVMKGRYPMSTLPREVNGSFQETDLRSLLKVYPEPNIDVAESKVSDSLSPVADNQEPAKLYKMTADVGNRVRKHSESECCWCIKNGCDCLASSNEGMESDDSELSCKSRDSRHHRSVGGSFECGSFPDSIEADDVACGIELKFGDIVTFGEYPSATLYVVGESGSLQRLTKDGFFTIPFHVSAQFQDPVKKYEGICRYYSSSIGELLGIYMKPDAAAFVKVFGGRLPSDWKCCLVAKCGTADLIDHFRIEVDEKVVFTALPPNANSNEDITSVTSIEDIYQRGQSLKESASFAQFGIELSIKEREQASLLERHGALYPKIATWSGCVSRLQATKTQLNVSVTWQGPAEDEDIVKAIVEEFYEGCTWRYGRVSASSA